MIQITMSNGKIEEVHHGSVENERRWCTAYLLNADMVATTLFYTDDDGLSVEENYGS